MPSVLIIDCFGYWANKFKMTETRNRDSLFFVSTHACGLYSVSSHIFCAVYFFYTLMFSIKMIALVTTFVRTRQLVRVFVFSTSFFRLDKTPILSNIIFCNTTTCITIWWRTNRSCWTALWIPVTAKSRFFLLEARVRLLFFSQIGLSCAYVFLSYSLCFCDFCARKLIRSTCCVHGAATRRACSLPDWANVKSAKNFCNHLQYFFTSIP